jgi:hypothetical protein
VRDRRVHRAPHAELALELIIGSQDLWANRQSTHDAAQRVEARRRWEDDRWRRFAPAVPVIMRPEHPAGIIRVERHRCDS